MTEPADELVEVVDEEGRVERIVTRAEMRAAVLRHRCAYVAVVTSDQEVVVHQRAQWKSIYPGYWDLAFGGVCGLDEQGVGETWRASAERELAEEAGLAVSSLEDLGAVRYEAADGRIVGRAFLARTDETPSCPDGEVIAVDRVPLAELDAWMEGRLVALDTASFLPERLRDWPGLAVLNGS